MERRLRQPLLRHSPEMATLGCRRSMALRSHPSSVFCAGDATPFNYHYHYSSGYSIQRSFTNHFYRNQRDDFTYGRTELWHELTDPLDRRHTMLCHFAQMHSAGPHCFLVTVSHAKSWAQRGPRPRVVSTESHLDPRQP